MRCVTSDEIVEDIHLSPSEDKSNSKLDVVFIFSFLIAVSLPSHLIAFQNLADLDFGDVGDDARSNSTAEKKMAIPSNPKMDNVIKDEIDTADNRAVENVEENLLVDNVGDDQYPHMETDRLNKTKDPEIEVG